jgi:hypothetical protein
VKYGEEIHGAKIMGCREMENLVIGKFPIVGEAN